MRLTKTKASGLASTSFATNTLKIDNRLPNPMPTDFVIDVENRVILTRLEGRITTQDMVQHIERLEASADFDPDFSELVDLTAATETAIGASGFDHLEEIDPFSRSAKRAFVVSQSTYGITQMFQTLRRSVSIQVFTSMKDARLWLGI